MDIQEALNRLKERLEADEAFEAELMADPATVVLRETGLTFDQLSEGVSELSEDDLADVTGGVGGGKGNLSFDVGTFNRPDEANRIMVFLRNLNP